jgi:hypothetical protein
MFGKGDGDMITKNQIAAIHIAKNQAGLNDQEYRDLLELAAGVRSSKELSPEDVTQVLNALKIKINHRKGWQNRQLKIFRRYCKYCFMSETEVRELLFETFGVFHEETPTLTNADFDDIMVTLEVRLEERVQANNNPYVSYNNSNGQLDLHYWRKRHPRKGGINTREAHKIHELWEKLSGYLSEEKRNTQYLLGFIGHVCRARQAKAIEDLSARESLKVIDALKQRITQEKIRLEKELADVPF